MEAFFRIESAFAVEFRGKDALRYLQARLTNDIKGVTRGRGVAAAALSPQGRTEGFFTVLQVDDQTFWLVCDGGDREAVFAAVKRYIVADRVETALMPINLIHVISEQLPGIPEASEYSMLDFQGTRAVARRRSLQMGADLLASRGYDTSVLLSSGLTELDVDERLRLRLEAAIPSFPEEINQDHLFPESGLEHALSRMKGCYTGQEVVEKVFAVGKLPRRLMALALDSGNPPPQGATISRKDTPIGNVITRARISEFSSICFSYLKSSGDLEGLEIGGANVRPYSPPEARSGAARGD